MERNKAYCLIDKKNISKNDIHNLVDEIYDDFESRDCENCKLQYDKLCPISDLNHPIKYCSEWETR